MKHLLLFFLCIQPLVAQDVRLLKKRIEMHLAINDPQSALHEVQELLKENPDDHPLLRLSLEALCACGKTFELMHAYKAYRQKVVDAYDPKLLEMICWTVLEGAKKSPSGLIRQHSLVSAFLTQDARLVSFCLNALRDSSSQVRTLMLKLASHVRDDAVQREVFRLFLQSTSPVEKLLAMQALSETEFAPIQEVLFSVLDDENSLLDEKVIALEALSQSLRGCSDDHLCKYLLSNRAYLRATCCHVIMRQQKQHLVSYVEPLVSDFSQEVRLSALQCIGLLAKKDNAFITSDAFLSLLNHSDVQTKILAAWVLVVHGKKALVKELLQRALFSSDKNVSLLTASILAHSQQEGLELLSWGVRHASDPLVRLNCAIGLIYLKKDNAIARKCILEVLESTHTRLSWHEDGIFSYIGPSMYCHTLQKAALPETVDLLTRLDLFRMLVSQNDLDLTLDHTLDNTIDLTAHIRSQLTARAWGVTLEASAFVMQEYTESFECLESLLDDKSPEVSLQAAFILAHFAQNEKALDILEKQYPKVSRELKEYILIAIGQIGAKSSLQFLTSVLDEPFESLRISAARSILLCLNH